jgi:hypothetical protein
MFNMGKMSPHLNVGSHGAYRWLTSNQENMNAVLRLCPEIVLGRYVAITTYDSGVLRLTDTDRQAGWRSRNGIAYSPQIRAIADLPECARIEPAELFQEWYVLDAPADLGAVSHENVRITPPAPGDVVAFVNYWHWVPDDPETQDLTDLFWKQLEALQPESYFGEGEDDLTFVTRNPGLFESVLKALDPTRGTTGRFAD